MAATTHRAQCQLLASLALLTLRAPTVASAPASEPLHDCDEAAEYRSKCAAEHERLSQNLRQWRFHRGLYLELQGQSFWGLGNVLPNVFLLHLICQQLRRYCYIKIYDMDIHLHMRFASDGLSWGPPGMSEVARYPGQNKTLVPIRHAMLAGYGQRLITELDKPAYRDVPLLHIKQATVLRYSIERFLPDRLPHGTRYERVKFPGQEQLARIRTKLSRCFCRFVTEPTFEVPSALTRRATVHLRTGFADIYDNVLRQLQPRQPDTTVLDQWFGLACPAIQNASAAADLTVITDAPLLKRYIDSTAARGMTGGRGVGMPHDKLYTSRSWKSGSGAGSPSQRAFADIIVSGRSRRLYASVTSTFPYPIIARSVCLPPGAAAVRAITEHDSPCAPFIRVWKPSFFGVSPHGVFLREFARPENRIEDGAHPCYGATAAACEALYVASLTGRHVKDVMAALASLTGRHNELWLAPRPQPSLRATRALTRRERASLDMSFGDKKKSAPTP